MRIPVRLALGPALAAACLALGGCPQPQRAARPPAAAPPAASAPAAPAASAPPLGWRSLAFDPQQLGGQDAALPALLAGHFRAGSADQQLLLTGPGASEVVDADLSVKAYPLKTENAGPDAIQTWDYDRDGLDELLVDALLAPAIAEDNGLAGDHGPDAALAIGLDGKLKGSIPCDMGSQLCTGDFDGDGHAELAAIPAGEAAALSPVYGDHGKAVGHFQLGAHEVLSLPADVDGDGTDELVRAEVGSQTQLEVYSLKRQRRALAIWPNELDLPKLAAPFSKPGADDVLGGYEFWSAAQQKTVSLASIPGDKTNRTLPPPLAVMQAQAGGPRWLALVPMDPAAPELTALDFYAADGSLVRQATVESDIKGLMPFQAGGVLHLAVLLKDKLLVYP
jgi:hypothetical protein